MGDYAVLLEMVKQTNEDLRHLRDNHLTHLQDDITEIKDDLANVRRDVDSLMNLKKEITELFYKHARFIVVIFIMGILATLGTLTTAV